MEFSDLREDAEENLPLENLPLRTLDVIIAILKFWKSMGLLKLDILF